MLPHRWRHRRRHALGMHEVPAPWRHREPGDRASDAISLQHSGHGGRRGRDRVVRPQHLAELAQFLRPHHPARRHRVHGFGRAHLERLQVLLLPHLLRWQGAEPGAEGHLQHRAQVAVRLDRRGQGRRHHARHRDEVAVGAGDLGLRGRRPGRRQSVGPRSRPRAIRSAGDLAHLVARSSDRYPGRHDLRARNAARQEIPLRRAHRGNADREKERDRDRVEFPGEADYRRRSDAGLRRSREMIFTSPIGRGEADHAKRGRVRGRFGNSESLALPLTPNPLPVNGERGRAETVSLPRVRMTAFILPLSNRAATDPEQVGPKAANLATLTQAGLPTPGGFSLTAAAYRHQARHLGIDSLIAQYNEADQSTSRRLSIAIRLAFYEQPIAPEILEPLLAAWRAQCATGALGVVRSSALLEDRKGANFAGQFESFLGLTDETEFLTAVRACWAALWTSNARRYMDNHGLDPADTAMAVLIQPLVAALASGGGLSETPDGQMLLSATWGLGSAIAQGEVVPDRIVLSRQGFVRSIEAGRKDRRDTCQHGVGAVTQAVPDALVAQPCLDAGQAVTLGRLLRKAENLMGMPVEIEWALDDAGFRLLQARPLHMEPAKVPDDVWLHHPRLNGHPAGIGWGTGRACVVNCECELTRIAPGDILITKVAGPALSQILSRVAGVVAERGGSTSHLASLARERGIPMVLGVLDATRRIPNGVRVAVDGVAGVVRWMR